MTGPELHPDEQKLLDKIIDGDLDYFKETVYLREILKANESEEEDGAE